MADSKAKSPTERIKDRIARGEKKIVIWVINMMLQNKLKAEHEKSMLKDEPYVRASEKFVKAIEAARRRLGLENGTTPESWIETLRDGVTSENLTDEDFKRFYQQFKDEIPKTLEAAELSKRWRIYVEYYIINNKPPERGEAFFFPLTMRVEDVSERGEIIVKLKPGLRYEDYTNAWKVFVKFLGTGARLNKPYTNTEGRSMHQDKQDGMSYREIAGKYFPSIDAILAIDRVKKAVAREKKRLSGDK